ncbi:MAG: antibiotic biosynthesis monooxygenase, partial [Gemmatimonadetes bacterium]|nr:antibiotic biosynthesis monooxygenase [Gemmatimonadota bacterium]NIR75772.1 antibiotic biosynthesis monooxygenase [Candidatus Kutchimonas denitrificans]NIT66035.1 antibiotic biosynthesis monooxygenase [Gemmatimonadota bacterium]NIY34613.1 antibiotic biosynthesis monooxygenase [Gemmatimonadota bacterium]NIY42850.1 antibiotic biosynthesis monooxygenase [Gemmatimonadota bacterium]
MIARIWHGRTRIEHLDEYTDYIEKSGIAGLRGTPGNRAAMIFRRENGAEAEFLVVSFWESMEAVKAFAGEPLERAVYYPEDEKYLLEFEPEVVHYE